MNQGETAKDFMDRMPTKARSLIKYDMLSFKDKYRKQKAKEPSTTVFAHLEKDGNRFIHPKQARTYTPREAARIQSFPDSFEFPVSESAAYRQIGNAIPPVLMWQVANALSVQMKDNKTYGRHIFKTEKKRNNVAHSLEEYQDRKTSVLEVTR